MAPSGTRPRICVVALQGNGRPARVRRVPGFARSVAACEPWRGAGRVVLAGLRMLARGLIEVPRVTPTRRAVAGAVQLRHETNLASEEYVKRKAWLEAIPPPCPFHNKSTACTLRPHGTYARKTPAGMRVRRFRCPQGGATVSLLPTCLAARMPGSLATVEDVVRATEQPGRPQPGSERELHPSQFIELASVRRWTRRRVHGVQACLTTLARLLPDRFDQLEPTLDAFGIALSTDAVLLSVRSLMADRLQQLPSPVGFLPRNNERKPPIPVLQHASARAPPPQPT